MCACEENHRRGAMLWNCDKHGTVATSEYFDSIKSYSPPTKPNSDYDELHTVATHAWIALSLALKQIDHPISTPAYEFSRIKEKVLRTLKELEAYGCHE